MSKVCVIFGGTKGIGAAIAKSFNAIDYKVCVLSRYADNVEAFIAGHGCHEGILVVSCIITRSRPAPPPPFF